MLRVREPPIVEYGNLPNTFGAMQAHTKDVRDWEVFTYATSIAAPTGFTAWARNHFRGYLPTKAFFDRSWNMGNIEDISLLIPQENVGHAKK